MNNLNKFVKRRIISFLIVLSFIAATIPSASAITINPNIVIPNIPEINTDQILLADYDYSIDSGKAVIKKYKGTGTNIAIPSTIKGSPVVEIATLAFSGCDSATNITVPDTVTKIGMDTFRDCSNLKSITLPNSITSIGLDAFAECSSLETINLPNQLQIIDLGTFNGCISLKSIIIPDSVTTIKGDAFYRCSGLTSIMIPKNVSAINGSALTGCTKLTAINVDSSNPFFCSDNGILYSKNKAVLIKYPGGLTSNSFTVPNTVKTIEASAFSQITNLKSITIPNGVTAINDYAFQESGLTSVIIPNSVTKLGIMAFSKCNSLTAVTIGSGVPSITEAFKGCSNLKNVSILSGVKIIGQEAFQGCSKLTSINIPDSVTTIGNSAFASCDSLTGIALPYSVASVKKNAFNDSGNLHNVWFFGKAPAVETGIFDTCASDFTIHYLSGKTGWTTPKWNGYPAEPFDPYKILPINPVLPLNPIVTPDPKVILPLKPFLPFDPNPPITTSSAVIPDTKITEGAVVIKLYLGKASYNVNGISHTMDANPILTENRIVLPIRYIAEPLGANPVWFSKEKKVEITMGDTVIELWIGKNIAKVNGVEKQIDVDNPNVKPIIVDPGRTMLPLRFIGECLGCDVSWNQSLQEATLIKQ